MPLVLADGSTVAAITGTADGPVRLRGICTFDDATLAAEAGHWGRRLLMWLDLLKKNASETGR